MPPGKPVASLTLVGLGLCSCEREAPRGKPVASFILGGAAFCSYQHEAPPGKPVASLTLGGLSFEATNMKLHRTSRWHLSFVTAGHKVFNVQPLRASLGERRTALLKVTRHTKRLNTGVLVIFLLVAIILAPSSMVTTNANAIYDVVVLNGRVIDPESQLDAVRNVGISNGTIKLITSNKLEGRTIIDAQSLVVAPGFIDLHQHGQNEENYRFKAMDGVTTALELEVGTGDVDRWYSERAGKALINYGVSAGHLAARMQVMHDPMTFLPTGEAARRAATDAEITEMKRLIENGLQRGAVAVGFGIQYVPQASHWEIMEMFRVAARFGATCHVHMRNAGVREPANSVQALEEVISAAAVTGAPLHVVHIPSTGLQATPQLLQMISEAKSRGIDITTECYPYTAGMTEIKSAIFNEGWQDVMGIDLQRSAMGSDGRAVNEREFRSLPEDRRICRDFFYDRRDRGECAEKRFDDDCKRRHSREWKRTSSHSRYIRSSLRELCS